METISVRELEVLKECYKAYAAERARVAPEDRREIIRQFAGCTQGLIKRGVPAKEIAEALGISVKVIYAVKHRCRSKVLSFSRTEVYDAMRYGELG